MLKIETALFEIGHLDRLAEQDSPIHRLDPRAKLVTTLVFLVCIVSFNRYEITGLLPFFFYPVTVGALADLPARYLVKKLLWIAPLALMVGAANPFFDRTTLLRIGSMEISGGWVSYASILLRFALTVGAALVLIATTSFNGICLALRRLGVPRIMTVQLLFVYRYLFILVNEGSRMVRARALRSFGKEGRSLGVTGSLLGHLLLRAIDRARHVHRAMLARGFNGEVLRPQPLHFQFRDALYILGWTLLLIGFRLINIPHWLGRLLT
ncbi:MAG: cobalt ECF transporter T component CbiQ [Desulfobacteraceae bacterium]|nr:MAG: cobalt ECF transporter T component CbiQ [Desulfobacteraceae bacterium]